MQTEELAIFDADMRRLGVKRREEVHRQGFWHETFHCWFLKEVDGERCLLFQRRAAQKKDFPNLLDITAAGHLLAGEQVIDGIREIEEELGIALDYQDLHPIGIIKEQIIRNDLNFIDREFCHVYLYTCPQPIESFVLQQEEVAGIIQIASNEFKQFVMDKIDTIEGTGYSLQADGVKTPIHQLFEHSDFCPHSKEYYITLLQAIK
jgi:isopentenyldiphosphate isomerase